MKNDTYRIYTRWLAVSLRKEGFKMIATDVNEYHPKYDVYIFENSASLQEAITRLTKNK